MCVTQILPLLQLYRNKGNVCQTNPPTPLTLQKQRQCVSGKDTLVTEYIPVAEHSMTEPCTNTSSHQENYTEV